MGRPRKDASAAPVSVEVDAGSVLRDLGSASQSGAARKGKPTPDDWEKFLTRVLEYASVGYVWWLFSDADDDEKESLGGDDLEMSREQAREISEPLGRILARSIINEKYGKQILGADDYFAVAIGVAAYAADTRKAYRAKLRRRNKKVGISRQASSATADGGAVASVNGNGAVAQFPVVPAAFTPGQQHTSD